MSTGISFYGQQQSTQQSALTRQRNLPYAGMPYFRSTSPPDHSSTNLVKTSRFSILHDSHAHQQTTPPSTANGNEKPNGHAKRSSKLPDIITVGLRRNRTTSLPHRPQTSDSRASRSASTKADIGQDSVTSVASSSLASVTDVDPFAAHPSSTSFVTYDTPGMSQHSHQSSSRSRPGMQSPQSVVHISSPAQASPLSGPSRRRGSILVAASDALNSISSSFARKKRPTGLGVIPPTPIILSEVIEISSSSNARLREHEDEERERLREVAAQSLGLGPVLLEDKLSRLNSGEDIMVIDREREHGRGRRSRLGRLSSDEEGEDDDDDEGDRPPESDITGFSSVSVPIPTPLPSPLSPSHQPQPIPALSQPFHSSSLNTPAIIPFTLQNRTRSGSVARSHHSHSHSQSHIHHAHNTSHSFSRANSTTPGPVQAIPVFPATHAMIKPFIQHQATFPKHYPPPSLLMFALAKQWKARFIVLSSPSMGSSTSSPRPSGSSYSPITSTSTSNIVSASSPTALKPSSGPAVSYLHLFKGLGPEEREIERLEINDDSVVYLSDDEVGGRRNVVKVGGIDVGAMRKELNPEEGGRTMWSLQIPDQAEAQKWIEGIKGAVLSQRSVRAGLGTVSHNADGVEPKGDLDVMLSMRAQGLFPSLPESAGSKASLTPRIQSSVTPQQTSFSNSPENGSPLDNRNLSPPATLSRPHSRGNATSPTPSTRQHNSAVSALRGLFSSNRPRSPSSTSVVSSSGSGSASGHGDDSHEQQQEDSFGAVGTNMLMLRSNSFSSESQFSPTSSVFSNSMISPGGGIGSPTSPSTPRLTTPTMETIQLQPLAPHMLDRKILPDSDRQQLAELAEQSTPNEGGNVNGGFKSGRVSALSMKDSDSTLRAFGSSSLQPPPRRRAWTSSGPPTRTSQDSTRPPLYTYSHANGSTAESLGVTLGVRQLNGSISGAFISSPGGPSTPGGADASGFKGNGNGNGYGHGRKRTSWSSATSSFTSGSGSVDHASSPELNGLNGRRRSLRNGNGGMLTPMNGSPATTPSPLGSSSRPSTGARHPYAAERPASPTSSGPSSPQSLVLDLRPLSPKRASGSSMHSFSTVSTSHSRSPGIFSHRPLSSHRASIPPPQRPAPLSALPPTPGQTNEELPSTPPPSNRAPQSAPATKGTFREILTHRAHRLSLSPPSHPPSSALPLRPDEPGFRPTHRKSASSSSVGTSPLYPIPASPTPPSESPYPPPDGPLPPTPSSPPASSPPTSQRHSISFKRRLRILSAPGPSLSRTPTPPITVPAIEPSDDLPPEPTPPVIPPSFYADPDIPLPTPGGPITTLQNDPNFLSFSSPSTPMMTSTPSSSINTSMRALPSRPLPPSDMLTSFVGSFESPTGVTMTSLSPPPRRASKRVSTPDKEKLEDEVTRSPHMVPSIMNVRVERDESEGDDNDAGNEGHDSFHDDDDDDDIDYGKEEKHDDDVDGDDDVRINKSDDYGNGHLFIQIHAVGDHNIDKDADTPDHSAPSLQPPPLETDDHNSSFNLSPPAHPHHLGDTASVISL